MALTSSNKWNDTRTVWIVKTQTQMVLTHHGSWRRRCWGRWVVYRRRRSPGWMGFQRLRWSFVHSGSGWRRWSWNFLPVNETERFRFSKMTMKPRLWVRQYLNSSAAGVGRVKGEGEHMGVGVKGTSAAGAVQAEVAVINAFLVQDTVVDAQRGGVSSACGHFPWTQTNKWWNLKMFSAS